jgi:hypothetical protein
MLVPDLQNYREQFISIRSEAQDLLGALNVDQLNWHPGANRWSIAQCVDHLLVTGRDSLTNMSRAIADSRARKTLSEGPFRYGLIERWFVRQMEPLARMRFRSPKAYLPSADRLPADLAASFYNLQDEFLRCIEDANGIDLSKTKVSNAVSNWFRFSLGQELAFNAAHERRHLWQARLVKQERAFPDCQSTPGASTNAEERLA